MQKGSTMFAKWLKQLKSWSNFAQRQRHNPGFPKPIFSPKTWSVVDQIASRTKYVHLVSTLLLFAAVAHLFVACTYKTPEVSNPVPHDEGIEKSFFQETIQDPKTGQVVHKPKTFLCGWAPVTEIGMYGEWAATHNAPAIDHCNMIFEITEGALLGKKINPSFPNNTEKWQTILTIPIVKHYYQEKQKDERGRETQNNIENDTRSHWSARPMMKLALAGMSVTNLGAWAGGWYQRAGWSAISTEDIEWDKDRNFLAFTTLYQSDYRKEDSQIRMRHNFLAFKSNPNFKKTPFNDRNYKYMNVLHLTGKRVEASAQEIFAGHWDMDKEHDIYLLDFPQEYEDIGRAIVEDWNRALREIGALKPNKKGFVVKTAKLKYNFDLRYTSMTWIGDKRVSSYSPLGIAMTHMDVRNGEFLWGGITIYGGMVEEYLKSYAASGSGSKSSAAAKAVGLFSKMLNSKLFNKELTHPAASSTGIRPDLYAQNSSLTAKELQKHLSEYLKSSQFRKGELKINSAELDKLIQNAAEQNMLGKIAADVQRTAMEAMAGQTSTSLDNVKDWSLGLSRVKNVRETELDEEIEKDPKKYLQSITGVIQKKYSQAVTCLDKRFIDVAPEWKRAFRPDSKDFDYQKSLRTVLKELISHEYGHFVGLGHQFKENIVPKKGTVPDSYVEALSAKATKEKNFTNYTSVMGYRHPYVEMYEKDEVLPGPQDKLVLRFLYNQQVAYYKAGDEDFSYEQVPQNGIIPDQSLERPEYKASYFPQCNDIDASWAIDPYCNRFDIGNNAEEIVESYLDKLDSNLIKDLFSFSDVRGGGADEVEGYLWGKSFSNLGRVRLFYDHMRYRYRDVFERIRSDEKALFEFSTACSGTEKDKANITSKYLLEIFKQNPELESLCRANALALKRYESLVSINATDHYKVDLDDHYSPGGLDAGEFYRDYSRMDGRWKEMSATPFKVAALYALSTPVPWVNIGSWMIPNSRYDNANLKYSYSSLYPQEYTRILAENVSSNLHFANLSQGGRSYIGSSILAMSYLSGLHEMNNDFGILPSNLRKTIGRQTQYDFSYVALLLQPVRKDSDESRVVRFNGQVYDFMNGKTFNLTEAYLLEDGSVIARGQDMFIMPANKEGLQFIKDTEVDLAYTVAIRATYSLDDYDKLEKIGIKSKLRAINDDIVNSCINISNGEANGLASFFNVNETRFKGFLWPKGYMTDEVRKNLMDSVRESFEEYYKGPPQVEGKEKISAPNRNTCKEAIKGMEIVVGTAALLNQFWFPNMSERIQK